MKRFIAAVCLALVTASMQQPVLAEMGGGGEGRRTQSGGINYAPEAAIYVVVSVDSIRRTVRIQTADGRAGDVHVGEGIYDISKLTPGQKIRVDFLVPEGKDSKLSAGSIWPVQ
jgi:hypothetical protein